MRVATTLLILALGFSAGCQSTLPRQPSAGPADALDQITQRTERINTLSARAVMTIRSDEGESIRLRVALAASGPDRMRMRAWKLGHAALDMTIRDDEVWLWTGGGSAGREGVEHEDTGRKEAGRMDEVFGRFFLHRRLAWHALRGGVPGRSGGTIEDPPGPRFRVSVPVDTADGSATLVAEIDRPTLTVRAYELIDGSGTAAGRRVRITGYRLVSGIPMPAEIRAEGERGSITLELEKVTPNAQLKAGALEPSPRARKLDPRTLERTPPGPEADG